MKRGNGSEEIKACVNVRLRTLSDETFCFLEKHLLSIFEFSVSSKILVFLQAADWPQLTFLECIFIFL